MADATRTIDLIFNGVDKSGAAVQSVVSNTQSLSNQIRGATQPFADITAAALKYEAALLATGGALTAFAVNSAGDFDGAFREIATLIDEPVTALDGFRESILEYATSSTGSLEDVTNSIYNAISAGVDYTDSLEAIRIAEQLSVAGKGDLDETLKVLVSTLNAYGLGLGEAERFSDALFTTVKLGQTTLPELNASLQTITGTAATLNVPFEEVLAALAALTSAGTPTAQAVTQLSGVLAAFLKPSEAASQTARSLGIEFDAQSIKAKGLQGSLQEVAEATGGSEELLAQLFPRVEALRAVFPLTGNAAEKFAEALTAIVGSAGATETAYTKMVDTLENVGQRLGNSFNVLLVAIGTPLLDDIRSVADAIGNIFTVLAGSFDEGELRQITQFIETEFANLATTLNQVAQALPTALSEADLSGFIDGLSDIQGAIRGLFGDLDLTDANDLVRALEFVGDSFEGLSKFSAGALDAFAPLFQFFADLADNANDSSDAIRSIGQAFGVATTINIFSDAIGGASTAVNALVGLLIANQGVSLVKGLSGVAGVLIGPQGLLAALVALAGFSSFKIFEQLNKLPEVAGYERLSTQLVDLASALFNLEEEAKKIEQTEIFPQSLERAEAEAAGIVSGLTNVTRALVGLNEVVDPAPLDNYVQRLNDAGGINFADQLNAQFDAFRNTGDIIEELDGKFGDFTGTLLEYPDDIRPASAAFEQLGADGQSLLGNLTIVSSGLDGTTASVGKLTDAAAELESKSLVASIEGATAINVAAIEADADKTVAAFETIGTAVQVTGESIQELFGLLGDENISKLDKFDVREQIERENERLDEQFRLEKRLTEAQIRKTQAEAERLRSGSALIEIDGSGLQPHLEAFMFEVLRGIQPRVAGPGGQNLLLGL